MALIPIEILDQMKKANLTPLTQPNKDRVVKEMAELSSLFRDEGLPYSLKASRYSEKLKDYSTFAKKLIEPTLQQQITHSPTVHPQQDMFASTNYLSRSSKRIDEGVGKISTYDSVESHHSL